jgi:hypothetical protein
MIHFIIATDGACQEDRETGQFSYIIQGYDGYELVLERTYVAGVISKTTDNRMQLQAILSAVYAVDDLMCEIGDDYSRKVEILCVSESSIDWNTGEFRVNDDYIRQYWLDIGQAVETAGIKIAFDHAQEFALDNQHMRHIQDIYDRCGEMMRVLRTGNQKTAQI